MRTLDRMLGRMGLTRLQEREADFCGVSDRVVLDPEGSRLVEGPKPVAMLGTATHSLAELAYDNVPAVNTACNVPEAPLDDVGEPCAMAPYDAGGIVAHSTVDDPAGGLAEVIDGVSHVYVDHEGNVHSLDGGFWRFTEATVQRIAAARLAELTDGLPAETRTHPWLNVGRAGPGMWWWEVVSGGGLAVLDDGEAPTWDQAHAVGQAALAQALWADALALLPVAG